jgi:hypothetical protein
MSRLVAGVCCVLTGCQLWQVGPMGYQGASHPQEPSCSCERPVQAQQQQGPAEAEHQQGRSFISSDCTAAERQQTLLRLLATSGTAGVRAHALRPRHVL